MTDGAFSLDRVENPHPRMLERALHLRRVARATERTIPAVHWLGYLEAMCDATGETAAALNAWLDHHDTGPLPDALPSQPVDIRGA